VDACSSFNWLQIINSFLELVSEIREGLHAMHSILYRMTRSMHI